MKRNRYPQGWNARRVKRVLRHYEGQTDDEAVAEDEALQASDDVMMSVPGELVAVVRDLIDRHHTQRTAGVVRAKQKTR